MTNPGGMAQVAGMTQAHIYQQVKNAMQSGRARVGTWELLFEPTDAQRPDPLTGWAGSADTRRQVRLSFPTLEAAKEYAERQGIEVTHVVPCAPKTLKIQAYADNFK